jgi:serine phosphatase RsbU (regulator of sigma subunit)
VRRAGDDVIDLKIDYAAVFDAFPGMAALLTPDLVYADANEEFLRLSGRTREQLIGQYLFDVFPDNPNDPAANGMRNLAASLHRVMATGERDTMALQRYDVQYVDRPGVWDERYWSPVNAPVLGEDGRVVLLLHRVEEVTELVRARAGGPGAASRPGLAGGRVRGRPPEEPEARRGPEDRARVLESELFTRARELQETNEELREAHAREREVALTLQSAMLPAPRLIGRQPAAVRYQPATGGLNVCGDWYDLADLPDGRITVAVGDVVGHGLAAAGVMGQLRSALSAASRVAADPAQALDALGLYARSVDGAECATAVTTFIDWTRRTITYSSAGHPPPALLHGDGTIEFLDQATDPPLAARPEQVPRPQAGTSFAEGDTLVLYTDGLVERRREDIDTGLGRLADSLIRHRHADPDALADTLLTDLLPPETGATDDTALVIVRL